VTFHRRHLLLLFFIPIIVLGAWLVRSYSPQPSSQLLNSDLPQLELELKHPNLVLSNTTANSQAVKLLFSSLGYEQAWHFFYLPQPEYHNQALFPQRFLFTVLPIEEYQSSIYGTLIAPIKYQGQLTSGFNCQPNPDQTLIHCHLFLNEPFFTNTNLSQTHEALIRYLYRVLFILSNQEIDSKQYPQALDSLLNQLEQTNLNLFEFSSPTSNSLQSSDSNWLETLLSKLQPPVFAQGNDYCEGFLECKVKEYYCRCLNGQVCKEDTICPDGSRCSNCSFWDCTGPWEQVDHLFCSGVSWPGCPNPAQGICEQDNPSAYCQTGGTCYPAGGGGGVLPTPTPPPAPDCPGVCCAADQICDGEVAGGVCPEGYTCCNSCSTRADSRLSGRTLTLRKNDRFPVEKSRRLSPGLGCCVRQ